VPNRKGGNEQFCLINDRIKIVNKTNLSKFVSLKIHTIMLQLNYIRENRDKVIERLGVKNFKEIGLVDEIITLDEQRRKIQSESDALSAEANSSAKKIGELMRQGKKEEAEAVKSQSSGYKEQIKSLTDHLDRTLSN